MEIGDGVTELLHNDRSAFTIIDIVSDEEIVIQRDNATETYEEYYYEPDPKGKTFTITKRRDSRWRVKGVLDRKKYSTFLIGVRDEHHHDEEI